jgi:hypothetical protein
VLTLGRFCASQCTVLVVALLSVCGSSAIAQQTKVNWQPDPICGQQIGSSTFQGVEVPAFSNGVNTTTVTDCGENPFVDLTSIYSYPYQCTEYVRRFYHEAVHVDTVNRWPKLPAKSYYAAAEKTLGLVAFPNKGPQREPPRSGDIIVFDGGKYVDPSGHVAIVKSDVVGDPINGGQFKIIEQNWTELNGIGTLRLRPRSDGLYEVYRLLADNKTESALPVLGWLRKQSTCPGAFADDFNRPDGPVGNGWAQAPDSNGGDLAIRNGRLTPVGGGGGNSSVYHPMNMSLPVTVSGTLTEQNGYYTFLLGAYSAAMVIGSTGSLSSGYGITFHRSDQNYANSDVELLVDGVPIEALSSTFQYGSSINVAATFEADGSIVGAVTGDGNTFNFSFGPRTVVLSGSNVSVWFAHPDTALIGSTQPTLDNLSLVHCEP